LQESLSELICRRNRLLFLPATIQLANSAME
jgi:hypothetical protein